MKTFVCGICGVKFKVVKDPICCPYCGESKGVVTNYFRELKPEPKRGKAPKRDEYL